MKSVYILVDVQTGRIIGVFDSELDAQVHASFNNIDSFKVLETAYYGECENDSGILG